jgi:hypothetical protein
MPFPRTGTFGLIDNPLVVSPFVANNSVYEIVPPPTGNFFLLLGGGDFLLLGGGKLELLG